MICRDPAQSKWLISKHANRDETHTHCCSPLTNEYTEESTGWRGYEWAMFKMEETASDDGEITGAIFRRPDGLFEGRIYRKQAHARVV
jgi:hypothetical protein